MQGENERSVPALPYRSHDYSRGGFEKEDSFFVYENPCVRGIDVPEKGIVFSYEEIHVQPVKQVDTMVVLRTAELPTKDDMLFDRLPSR